MKRKILFLLLALTMSVASHAQFEQGKKYASASVSGLDLNFNDSENWKFDLSLKGGYMFEEAWMLTGELGYGYHKFEPNFFQLGAGVRYYIEQNGLFLGAGANYVHRNYKDDFMPTIQLGYSYFISRTVTIEPELYYNQSLKDHADYSGFGFRIGFGIYLD
jgi:outer membrane scaffolding protein for murein synthesis (MipA/OmpV family)